MPKAKYKPSSKLKSIDQLSIAKIVATRLGMSVSQVVEVVEMEQKITMQHVKNNYKVIKKNYITFIPIVKPGYLMHSRLDSNTYEVPERTTIRTKVGQGFKSYVSDNSSKMPDNICRFVDRKEKDVKEIKPLTA
ncbi:MAG: HU family DNA-binding protein [Acholeplasmataceae bacterium]|nr:HU family DNA-binding protein [Acholeplasmataceae bacterium]